MAAGVPGGARRQHLRRRPGPPAQLPSLASSFTSHLSPLPLGDPIGQARSHGLPSPRASSTGGWRPAARRPPPHGYTLAFEANLGLDASCVKWSGGGGFRSMAAVAVDEDDSGGGCGRRGGGGGRRPMRECALVAAAARRCSCLNQP
jgi:hypothetical protein